MLNPIEQFVVTTSYRLNQVTEKESDVKDYRLREELQRLLIRADFASLDGIIYTFHLDDLRLRTRSESGKLIEDVDTSLSTGLNLLPGAWVKKLEMLTVAGAYSLVKQTLPVGEEGERAIHNVC